MAEGANDEELARYRLLFETSPSPAAVFSFETARFVVVNDAYLAFLHETREEFMEADPYELWVRSTHPDDFEKERSEVQRMVEGDIDGYKLCKRYLQPNGEYRWAELTTHSIRDERGRLRYSVFHIVDVHETQIAKETRERLEERLRQAQKLETVGRLVGGVAHDFNNRLLVIMGYSELLKRGVVGDPELEGHADIVLESAKGAADLTRQLLAFGRRQLLKPRTCDPNTLVDRMRRMLERLIGESVELVTVLGAKHPMLADTPQIEQVLMNLVLNARDAMQGTGRVTIETADTEVPPGTSPELAPGWYVSISIADTGPGIPESVRQQIFEPFFTTKEIGKGTGLGLAMVDGIVRQSGGIVCVKSVEGRGATFTVYLPRAAEVRRESPLPWSPATDLPDVETVMIVDDDEAVRRLLVDVLAIGAYQVLEARDGERALEVAQGHSGRIDLLVTDIVMPKMKGTELSQKLRQRYPGVLTLFISGYAERDALASMHPNEHFLAKPFLPADLFRTAREVLAMRVGRRVEEAG